MSEIDTSLFALDNCISEDEALELAYDMFLELAPDNLDPADILLFNLQFEDRGAAELIPPTTDWQNHVDFAVDDRFFSEVIIGLFEKESVAISASTQDSNNDNSEPAITDIFARVLICREKSCKHCHILWRDVK